jgi:hypothetical protein
MLWKLQTLRIIILNFEDGYLPENTQAQLGNGNTTPSFVPSLVKDLNE